MKSSHGLASISMYIFFFLDLRVNWEHARTNLSKEHALRLQVQTHAVPLVVQEVLKTQELDCAK